MNEEKLMQEIELLKREIEDLKRARGSTLSLNRFGKFIKKSFTKLNLVIGIVITLVASSLIVYATQISKPYTFTDGTVISASEVNANFDALYGTAWSKVDTGGIYYDSGNVGIGTASPRAMLDLGGNLLVGGTEGLAGEHFHEGRINLVIDSGSFPGIVMGSEADAYMYGYGLISVSEANNDNFGYWTMLSDTYDGDGGNFHIKYGIGYAVHGFQSYLTILNDGRVGVGTTSPDFKLSIGDGTTARMHICGADSVVDPPEGSCVIYFDGYDLRVRNSAGSDTPLTTWGG